MGLRLGLGLGLLVLVGNMLVLVLVLVLGRGNGDAGRITRCRAGESFGLGGKREHRHEPLSFPARAMRCS